MGGSQHSRHAEGAASGHGVNPYFITSIKPGTQTMKNLRQLYRKMDKDMSLVDTFWEAKKSLIKDFDHIIALDQHAINTPHNLNGDMNRLVQHLIRPAKTPLQKYRVLCRWIAENISYDIEGLRAGAGVSNADEALRRGVAVCGGYVNLFKRLCEIADLQCESVHGYDKGANYYVGHDNLDSSSHAWSLIYLGGKPFYCDPTWAAGHVDKSQRTYTKDWSEHWFMAEPSHFENTHLPNDQSESTSGAKDQSLERWNRTPKIGTMMHVMKTSLIDKEGVLKADKNNEIDISFKMEVLGSIQHFLWAKSTGFKQDIPYHVMHFWNDNKITLHVRLPGPDTYKLDVYATKMLKASKKSSECTELYNKLVTYTIIGKSPERNKPLKKRHFGSLPIDVLKGYSCMSHTKPVIETSTNRVVIEYSCPRDGDLLVKLSTEHQSEVSLPNRIYQERLKKKHVFHIHLPSTGWYYVYFHNEPKSELYTQFAVFMIHFTGQSYINPVFPDGIKWNPSGIYYESKLKCVSHKSSFIRLPKGEGNLALTRPFQSQSPLTFGLYDINSNKLQSSSEFLFVDSNLGKNDLERTNVTFRINKEGFYVLHLFVVRTLAMRWLVVCEKSYAGDLFPLSNEPWGPNLDDFKTLDLSMSCDAFIYVPRGSTTVKVALGKKKNLNIFGKLVEANGRENLSYQKAVRVDDTDPKFRDIEINLPEHVNEACLELYGGDRSQGNSFPRIGKWFVVRK